jgi:hypothetical protein
LRELQRLLLHAHILSRQLQIVVGKLHTRDGVHDLLAKAQPGNAQEFFADLDISSRGSIYARSSSKVVADISMEADPGESSVRPEKLLVRVFETSPTHS